MDKPLPEILTIHETSEYLRIRLSSLYKLAQAGKIPCQKAVPCQEAEGHWRFRREAIERWLDSRFKAKP